MIKNINELKDKVILVTGGAGFIGSNICEYLLSIGSIVRCLDNFSTGHMNNIKGLIENKNFELINGDIRDLKICQIGCKGVDFILHQAALGSVPRSIKDPILSTSVNINGFLNILKAASENKVERLIYAGSSSTYGDLEELPKYENKIGTPLSPYAITKYVNELYARNFKLIYNLDSIGLRYFNVFGPKQDPNSVYSAVIPKFIIKLINHESPLINGDGNFSRDFTFIDNVIRMNVLALLSKNKDAINEVYNTATGNRISILEMTKYIKNRLSIYDNNINKIKILHGPIRDGDIPHSLADISKSKTKLGYDVSVDIKLGLDKTVDWFWKNKKKYKYA